MFKCCVCGKEVESKDSLHKLIKNKADGTKEEVLVCDECYNKCKQTKIEKQNELTAVKNTKKHHIDFDHTKVLIWSIVFGVIAFVIALVVGLVNKNTFSTGSAVGLSFLACYIVLSTIYCLFTESWVSEVFSDVASWSIKFPGIIFSFDLDGLVFLIAMKLLFAVLGFLIGLATLLLAVLLSALFSIFTFPFLIIYHCHGN